MMRRRGRKWTGPKGSHTGDTSYYSYCVNNEPEVKREKFNYD